jgi:hypothetical protein
MATNRENQSWGNFRFSFSPLFRDPPTDISGLRAEHRGAAASFRYRARTVRHQVVDSPPLWFSASPEQFSRCCFSVFWTANSPASWCGQSPISCSKSRTVAGQSIFEGLNTGQSGSQPQTVRPLYSEQSSPFERTVRDWSDFVVFVCSYAGWFCLVFGWSLVPLGHLLGYLPTCWAYDLTVLVWVVSWVVILGQRSKDSKEFLGFHSTPGRCFRSFKDFLNPLY